MSHIRQLKPYILGLHGKSIINNFQLFSFLTSKQDFYNILLFLTGDVSHPSSTKSITEVPSSDNIQGAGTSKEDSAGFSPKPQSVQVSSQIISLANFLALCENVNVM